MNKSLFALLLGVLVAGSALLFFQSNQASKDRLNEASTVAPDKGGSMVAVSLAASLEGASELGKTAFDAKCAVCHGTNAAGQDGMAPPLIHKIYEPGHRGDGSFQLAVKNGVPAHHWCFGNMAPFGGLTRGDVSNIIAYVRTLQRANGIS